MSSSDSRLATLESQYSYLHEELTNVRNEIRAMNVKLWGLLTANITMILMVAALFFRL